VIAPPLVPASCRPRRTAVRILAALLLIGILVAAGALALLAAARRAVLQRSPWPDPVPGVSLTPSLPPLAWTSLAIAAYRRQFGIYSVGPNRRDDGGIEDCAALKMEAWKRHGDVIISGQRPRPPAKE
jgi:hypothetical protein